MGGRDWREWHDGYDVTGSTLQQRLAVVQAQVRAALDTAPPGEIRVVSLCAGQGRDLLGVLPDHPRRGDVVARLVELDPVNADLARRAAATAGLDRVEVVVGDAALTDQYRGMVPADLVLLCGIFGNLTDEDIECTVAGCAALCAPGGTVVWTRHRRPPDLVPRICEWFTRGGFVLAHLTPSGERFGVGAHRFGGTPRTLEPGNRLFRFVGYDALRP